MNCGERNSRSGSIGCVLRCSTTRNATSATTPTTAADHAGVAAVLDRRVRDAGERDRDERRAGDVERGCSADRVSGTCRTAIQIAAAASGTLIRNTSRQLTASISQPPRNGPIELATPASPDHAPIARPGRRGGTWRR